MDLFSFFLSDVVPRGAQEKLEPMPVEDAGEREEKQRDEPSQLSGPIWQCPRPPGRRSPTQRAHLTVTSVGDGPWASQRPSVDGSLHSPSQPVAAPGHAR